VGLIVGQALLVAGFVVALWRFSRPRLVYGKCPKAAVVLCLRGTDPFLTRCVESLLDQDYPDFQVRVVVDCEEDSAWAVVTQVIAQRSANNIIVQPLTRRLETCSLKCSSLVQAISSLDQEVEIVAQLDADTIPHRTWLRELAAALAEEQVGAATGNRWYMPQKPTWGALVRYLWNAAAVVQMYSYGIAWGGTLALKTKVIQKAGLLDRWSNSFCEDTMLFSNLRRCGYRVEFVPSLMMVNRESCDLAGFSSWVRRQLLAARLYHPGWFAVVSHGVATTLLPVAALVVAVWSAATAKHSAAIWSAAGLIVYQLAMLLLLGGMELTVRRIVASRNEPTIWASPNVLLKLLLAVPLTQVAYARSLWSAVWLRLVEWRGVSYQVNGPWKIRLKEYQPFRPPQAAEDLDSL